MPSSLIHKKNKGYLRNKDEGSVANIKIEMPDDIQKYYVVGCGVSLTGNQ